MPRYLVTSALPYANGPIHFGQVIGAYLPADVYVRTLRMHGEDARFICGTDEYGTAIPAAADAAGVPYEEWVAGMRDRIRATFDKLAIEFDIFSGTSICPHHTEVSQEFFRRLDEGGYLIEKETDQLYSPVKEQFLADRYVEGTCPKCGYESARGDECPSCGTWVEALELGSPRAKIGGEPLERRKTTHWFLDLPKLRDERIQGWFEEREWKVNVEAFVRQQLKGIKPRAITRDLNWGVPVPEEIAGKDSGKVLYVWFDAPIGYVSMTREWAEAVGRPEAWKDYWQPADPSDVRLVHFIGKDNIPFHCVVFPSMLYGVRQDYVLPADVPANEFYNLQGRKFSTSGGWGIPVEEFFERYDSDAARFYLISSTPETADSEWLWEEFQRVTNSSLADKIGNLATRVLRMIEKNFDGRIPACAPEHVEELDRALLVESGEIGDPGESILAFRFRQAADQLVANAAVGNVFVDRMKPWALRKTDPEMAQSVLATTCEWLSWLARWMAPFMPHKAQELWAMLGRQEPVAGQPWPGVPAAGSWRSLEAGQPLGEVAGLFRKIEDSEVEEELQRLNERAAAASEG